MLILLKYLLYYEQQRWPLFYCPGIANAYAVGVVTSKAKKRAVAVDNNLRMQKRKTTIHNIFYDGKRGTKLTAKYKSTYSFYINI